MATVYILQSQKTQRRYTGCTIDLEKRLLQHNAGQVPSTRNKGPWQVIYTKQYATKSEALRRERVIKSFKGGTALTKLLGE